MSEEYRQLKYYRDKKRKLNPDWIPPSEKVITPEQIEEKKRRQKELRDKKKEESGWQPKYSCYSGMTAQEKNHFLYEKYREYYKNYYKDYYKNNKELLDSKKEEWIEKNGEQYSEYIKEYYKTNRDKYNLASMKYYYTKMYHDKNITDKTLEDFVKEKIERYFKKKVTKDE